MKPCERRAAIDLPIDVVVFPDIVMNDIFNYIQHDKHEKREHEDVERSRLEVFLEDEFEHCIVLCIILCV